MSEKELENQILDWLAFNKIFAWKNQTVGIYDPTKKVYRMNRSAHHLKGVSDILGILPNGRLLAIEVKTPTGVVSPEQKAFIEKAQSLGAFSIVARSLEDVKRVFPEIKD